MDEEVYPWRKVEIIIFVHYLLLIAAFFLDVVFFAAPRFLLVVLFDDVPFLAEDLFFDADFFFAAFFTAPFFRGTFAPASLASERPMAMACLRLVTFLPLRPLLSVPRFFSCIASSTFSWAFFEYFAILINIR